MSTRAGTTTTTHARAATAPAFLKRLPPGVEYTHVKMILWALPAPTNVLAWVASDPNEPIWSLFRGKTFRALDRVLQQRERQLVAIGPAVEAAVRAHIEMLRHYFVQHFLFAIQDWDPHRQIRWLTIRLVTPPPGTEHMPGLGLEHRGLVFEVWAPALPTPELLDRVVMPPSAPPWGDPAVSYYDPVLADRLTGDVLRRHFPEVMRRRIGQGWRSERDPVGWPMVTQRVVPALYDYLRPFYSVRPYRKGLRFLTGGDYPTQLLQDITDVLRFELPYLAADLTVERVQAAVQRYVRQAPRQRPMGRELFGLGHCTETP
jgi:hypothetical protein